VSQVAEVFEGLLDNLRVKGDAETVASRRDEITKALNKEFRGLDGSTANRLMVGSYGRHTAIKGISDLDLLYTLPASERDTYEKEGGPSKVLARTCRTIQARYKTTTVYVDSPVVVVVFSNFMFEVQPVFENSDESFSYPYTKTDTWKITKPREEISAMTTENNLAGGNLRKLCRFTRAWKNRHGVAMGGLVIDTLAHNFMKANTTYRSATSDTYDQMMRDFFLYLSEEDDHEFYLALGSRQQVRVKKKFQRQAKKAYNLCVEAIDSEGQKNTYTKWRAVFGTAVPVIGVTESALTASAYTSPEQYIEQHFPVDIRNSVTINCEVTQDGFRPQMLRDMLALVKTLPARKSLTFNIEETDVAKPYDVRWKVLNRGTEAVRRRNVRGGIIESSSKQERREVTSFRGEHLVECYLIKNGVVVARDSIDVPIHAE
jgi:hypothetical protein